MKSSLIRHRRKIVIRTGASEPHVVRPLLDSLRLTRYFLQPFALIALLLLKAFGALWIVPVEVASRRLKRPPVVTLTLIAVLMSVFLYQLFHVEDPLRFFAVYGHIPRDFLRPGLFSAMFIHTSVLHLAWNVIHLWIFGRAVEDKIGGYTYLILFFTAGLFAMVFQSLGNPASAVPAVGASGCLSGVLGAFFILFPGTKVRLFIFHSLHRVSASFYLAGWYAIQLLLAVGFLPTTELLSGAWAHVGGFFFGVSVVLLSGVRRDEFSVPQAA